MVKPPLLKKATAQYLVKKQERFVIYPWDSHGERALLMLKCSPVSMGTSCPRVNQLVVYMLHQKNISRGQMAVDMEIKGNFTYTSLKICLIYL